MSNLSDVGFKVDSVEDFQRLALQAASSGEVIKSPRGYYIRWSVGEDIELWAQANAKQELLGCNPHFSGDARIRMAVEEVKPGAQSPLDGSLHGWANPPEDDPHSGGYPFTVDIPDFDLIRDRIQPPFVVTLQVAAFARELSCYSNDDDFSERQPVIGENEAKPIKWAPESFVPLGAFLKEGEYPEPRAEAMFAGHVLSFDIRTNPQTECKFYHIVVRTIGGDFDAVADPLIVKGDPVIGGVVQGLFWLSGRVVSELPEARRRSLMDKLLGR